MREEAKLFVTKQRNVLYVFEHYKGSLDYPCNFCDTHSYDNFHISKDGILLVFCKACFDKVNKDA